MTSTSSGHPRRWWILVVLCMSLLVLSMDNTILNVALPTLVRDLDASASQLQWMVDSYVLVFAGLLLIAGSLGDKYGRKLALFAGYGIFGLSSLLAAYAGSADQLIAARAVMGIGGALIMPSTLSILVNAFPRGERPRAIAIWAATAGIGVPLGPVIGGWLLEHYWWGSIFLVNIPIVAAALLIGIWLIPESRDEQAPPIDIPGGILSVLGLTALLYAIIEAPSEGWTSGMILLIFAVAIVIFAGFIIWERRTRYPMLNLSFFKNPRFSAGSAAISLVFFALFGSIFLLTQYLQFVMGYTPLEAGIRMTPVAIGIAFGTGLSQRIVQNLGAKIVVATGMAIVAVGLLIGSTFEADSSYGMVALMLVTGSFGMGLAMAPATDAIMAAIPEANAGVGSAVNDTTRQVGGALGVAILGSLYSTIFNNEMADVTAQLPPQTAQAANDSIGGALQVARQIGGSTGSLLANTANSSFVEGMTTAMLIGSGIALAGAAVALFFLPAHDINIEPQESTEPTPADATAEVAHD